MENFKKIFKDIVANLSNISLFLVIVNFMALILNKETRAISEFIFSVLPDFLSNYLNKIEITQMLVNYLFCFLGVLEFIFSLYYCLCSETRFGFYLKNSQIWIERIFLFSFNVVLITNLLEIFGIFPIGLKGMYTFYEFNTDFKETISIMYYILTCIIGIIVVSRKIFFPPKK